MKNLTIDRESEIPLYVQLGAAIKKNLEKAEMALGDRLPSEAILARDLNLSRLTVSRAYQWLEVAGAVTRRRGSGTFVGEQIPSVRQFALVMNDPDLVTVGRFNEPIANALISGLQDAFGESIPLSLPRITRSNLETLRAYDGLCFIGLTEPIPQATRLAIELCIPAVQVGFRSLLPEIPCVIYDRSQAARSAVEHLADQGYRQIGYIGYALAPLSHDVVKFNAYVSVMKDRGLDICMRHVWQAGRNPGEASAATARLLQAGDAPEAIFVDTDNKAMEVISVLQAHGLVVPRDVAIASYGDVPAAADFDPALTTIQCSKREMGRLAGEMLMRWAEKGGDRPQDVILETELVVRASSVKDSSVTPVMSAGATDRQSGA